MNDQQKTLRQGLALAVGTYLFWGLFPLYFKWVGEVPPIELLIHRILWSAAFTAILVTIARNWLQVLAVFGHWRHFSPFIASALLLATNWLIFVYGIAIDDMLQLSLGYFINPLFNAVFGLVFFREKIPSLTRLGIALAVLGLLIQLSEFDKFPWLAVSVALVFSLYGVVRKKTQINVASGLFLESALLVVPALAYLSMCKQCVSPALMMSSTSWLFMLVLAGPLTSIPLMTFSMAIKKIPYYLVGFCQYLTPTMIFLLAVLVFGEHWRVLDILTFLLVWAGIALSLVNVVAQIRTG